MTWNLAAAAASVQKFREDTRGVAAVEFALIAPMMMLFMFGMIAFAIYFGAAHSVQQLTADAARSAIAGLDATEREDIVNDYITANISSYSLLNPEHVTHDLEETPTQIVVAIRYDARDLPIWNLFPGIPMPDPTITRTTTIRIGGI